MVTNTRENFSPHTHGGGESLDDLISLISDISKSKRDAGLLPSQKKANKKDGEDPSRPFSPEILAHIRSWVASLVL